MIVLLAQFFLNRLQLLAQNVLLLHLAHFRSRLRLDLARELEDFYFLVEERCDLLDASQNVERLEDVLLFDGIDIDVGRNQIGKFAGVVGVHRCHLKILRERR